MRLHLDTDIGGDIDDACALAMLLGSGVEIAGVTTVHDPDGRRAGYVHRLLELSRRDDVPVAAGRAPSMTTGTVPGALPDEVRYWGEPIATRPDGDAVELLRANAIAGVPIVAIGPFTNLALAGAALGSTHVVLMGGWDRLPRPELPQWGPEMDWNVTCDRTAAAQTVAAAGRLTVAPLAVTMEAQLHRVHLPRLRAAGAVGELLARQAEAHAADQSAATDLVNYQYDSVACATALGWPAVRVEPSTMSAIVDIPGDRPIDLVTAVDGPALAEAWLAAIEAITG